MKQLRRPDPVIWEGELQSDFDAQFILEGLEHGFDIIDLDAVPVQAEFRNHKSAMDNRHKVEAIIQNEIECGNYEVVDAKPLIVSALGAVPKDEDDIRLIHDCSLPDGRAVNDYASYEPFSLQSFDDAMKTVTRDSFMCKIDLRAAYRSILISKASQKVTGLQWTFKGDDKPTYMVDRALCFGARAAPGIFNRITQAVCRMMHRRGYLRTFAYLDDFVIIMDSFAECLEAMNTLLALLIKLGFLINYDKVVGPSQSLVFLGIEINTVEMTVSLPDKKLIEL